MIATRLFTKSGNLPFLPNPSHSAAFGNLATAPTSQFCKRRSHSFISHRHRRSGNNHSLQSSGLQTLLKKGIVPATRPCNLLLISVFKSGRLHLVTQIFSQILSNRISPNVHSYTIAIDALGRRGEPWKAEQLVVEMQNKGLNPNVVTFNVLIHGQCFVGNLSRAFDLLRVMDKKGTRPDAFTYNILINGLCKQRDLQKADAFMQEMGEKNLSPNNVTYCTVIDVYLSKGMVDSGIRIYEHMVERGISPDVVTYSVVIQAFCRAGRMREVCETLERVKKSGLVIDPTFYEILIHAFCSAGDLSNAMMCYDDMLKGEILPCDVVYVTLMETFCRKGNLIGVLAMQALMIKWAVPFSADTYCNILKGFCKMGNMEEADNYFQKLREEGVSLDMDIYGLMLERYCRDGNMNRVLELLEDMDRNKLSVSQIICNAILNAVYGSSKKIQTTDLGTDMQWMTLHGDNALNVVKDLEAMLTELDLVTCNVLIKLFCMLGCLNSAVELLRKMQEKQLVLSDQTYFIIISKQCKSHKFEEAVTLWNDMRSYGIDPDRTFYDSMIYSLCGQGIISVARNIFDEALGKSVSLDVNTIRSLIIGYIQMGDLQEAFQLVMGMESYRYRPTDVVYNAFLAELCNEHRFDDALDFYHQTEIKGMLPDFCNFVSLIKGLYDNNQKEEADQLVDRLGENLALYDRAKIIDSVCEKDAAFIVNLYDRMEDKGLKPSFFSLNAVFERLCTRGMTDAALSLYFCMFNREFFIDISTLCLLVECLFRQDCLNEANIVFRTALQNGLDANAALYNTMIISNCEKGSVEDIISLYNDMLNKGFLLDTNAYHALIYRLCQEKCTSEVLRIHKDMSDKSIMPTAPGYNLILGLLCKEGNAEQASQILKLALQKGVIADVAMYTIVINALCKQSFLEEALHLCKEMENEGIIPNVVTYNTLIHGLCSEGRLVEAFRLFDSFERKGFSPTLITYSILVRGLCKEGYLEDAKELLKQVITKGISPDIILCNLVIHGFCKHGKLDEALTFLSEMEKWNIQPNTLTLHLLIKGYCKKCNVEAALLWFHAMEKNALQPNLFTYIHLINGLCHKGRLEEASKLLEEMLHRDLLKEIDIHSSKILKGYMGTEWSSETIPNSLSFSNIIRILCTEGNILEAERLLRKLETKDTYIEDECYLNLACMPLADQGLDNLDGNIDSTNHMKIIISLYQAGRMEDAMKQYNNMVQKGCIPNFRTFMITVNHLIANDQLQEANKVINDTLTLMQT